MKCSCLFTTDRPYRIARWVAPIGAGRFFGLLAMVAIFGLTMRDAGGAQQGVTISFPGGEAGGFERLPCTLPSFTVQPQSKSVCAGRPASFNVSASRATYFQWRKNSVAIPGATSSTYSILQTTPADAGSYTCDAGNSCGITSSLPAILTVKSFVAPSESFVFSHFVGSRGGPGFFDGNGGQAGFNSPTGLAVDSAGFIYVGDQRNATIRKISPSRDVTTMAGVADLGPRIGDGRGADGRFAYPMGVAVDPAGTLFVADQGASTIRKVSASGVVTTIAGLASTVGSADGIGSQARFAGPSGVALDSFGNLFILDSGNSTVRRMSPAGVVSTVAGLPGVTGNLDGQGSAARFYWPEGLASDSAGNVFVADTWSHTIRKVTPSGNVTTIAGLAGSSGTADGSGFAARFTFPRAIAVDPAGNLWVADTQNFTIRKVTPTGDVTTIAGLPRVGGTTDGTGSAARFLFTTGIAVDAAGDLYVADRYGDVIRKVTPAGIVTTIAGMAPDSGSVDAVGDQARFNTPDGVALDSSGNLYVADEDNDVVRKVDPSGHVTTFAGLAGTPGSADGTGSAARFNHPTGVATDSAGNVYVADFYNDIVRKISPSGVVVTFAGQAGSSGSDDGTRSAARFDGPYGVAVDSASNVYVSDGWNDTIRKVTPAGVVTTLAGLAGFPGSSDGSGIQARFDFPMGVATDATGNVFVADHHNHTVRKVTPAGVVSTLAGIAGWAGSDDGTGSEARFWLPWGVAADTAGDIYVTEPSGNTIRKVTQSGVVTTIAGMSLHDTSADGIGRSARFASPTGIAIDCSGTVYVSDSLCESIRRGRPALAAEAVIDLSPAPVGALRQLDISPPAASTWSWEEIRQPSRSVAALSSSTISNPEFIPDDSDLFVFRLVASDGSGSESISTVSLAATATRPIPDGHFVAGAAMTASKNGSNVDVAWDAANCPASGVSLYWGAIGDFSAFTGGACDLGTSGRALNVSIPGNGWWVLAATTGSGISSFGLDSTGAEEIFGGWGAGGICPSATTKVAATFCP